MTFKHINVLLADDDMDDCIFFKQALTEATAPTNLVAVHDGEQLMSYLSQTSRQLIDVLFLDLNMPRKNGFECLAEIRLSEKLKELPVIVFSTSFEQDVVNQLYANGAHYFIRKPSDFKQYKRIIQQTLALFAQRMFDDKAGNLLQPSKDNFVLTVENTLVI